MDLINEWKLELVKENNYFHRLAQSVLPRGAVCRHFHPRVLGAERIEVIKMSVIKFPCWYKVITTKKEKPVFSTLTLQPISRRMTSLL